jgi:hypothetical protein
MDVKNAIKLQDDNTVLRAKIKELQEELSRRQRLHEEKVVDLSKIIEAQDLAIALLNKETLLRPPYDESDNKMRTRPV